MDPTVSSLEWFFSVPIIHLLYDIGWKMVTWFFNSIGAHGFNLSFKTSPRRAHVLESNENPGPVILESLNHANPAVTLKNIGSILRIVAADGSPKGTAFIARDFVGTATHNINAGLGPEFVAGSVSGYLSEFHGTRRSGKRSLLRCRSSL